MRYPYQISTLPLFSRRFTLIISQINFDKGYFVMPKASEIKKGFVIESNGKMLLIKDIEITTPGGRGGAKIYKLRCTDLATGSRVDERFKSDDVVDTVEMTKRASAFSYTDGDEYVFMDTENFDQYSFNK